MRPAGPPPMIATRGLVMAADILERRFDLRSDIEMCKTRSTHAKCLPGYFAGVSSVLGAEEDEKL